jgi:hypothetical protein
MIGACEEQRTQNKEQKAKNHRTVGTQNTKQGTKNKMPEPIICNLYGGGAPWLPVFRSEHQATL